MSQYDFPSLDEIYEELDRFVDEHPSIVRTELLGASADGLDVRAVHVTDADVDEVDKEVVMVVCGQHGNELGTRSVGQAVLEWLASEEGTETKRVVSGSEESGGPTGKCVYNLRGPKGNFEERACLVRQENP